MATLFVDKIDPQSGTSLEIGSSGDTISKGSGVVSRLGVFESQLLHVRDEKGQDTNGGQNSAGVNTRTLNTVKTNEITGASLSSNQITLPAGTYYIEATAPSYRADRHVGYLYNTTDSSITIQGIPAFGDDTNGTVSSFSLMTGRFTISAQKVFEFRHWIQTVGTFGFGLSSAQPGTSNVTGIISIYTDVKIWRTA